MYNSYPRIVATPQPRIIVIRPSDKSHELYLNTDASVDKTHLKQKPDKGVALSQEITFLRAVKMNDTHLHIVAAGFSSLKVTVAAAINQSNTVAKKEVEWQFCFQ